VAHRLLVDLLRARGRAGVGGVEPRGGVAGRELGVEHGERARAGRPRRRIVVVEREARRRPGVVSAERQARRRVGRIVSEREIAHEIEREAGRFARVVAIAGPWAPRQRQLAALRCQLAARRRPAVGDRRLVLVLVLVLAVVAVRSLGGAVLGLLVAILVERPRELRARQRVRVANRPVDRRPAGRGVDPRDERDQHEQDHEQQPRDPPAGPVARPCRGSYGADVPAPLTDNALAVLRARYLARHGGVVVETPDQLFHRVAHHVAAAETAMGYSAAEVAAAQAAFERMMSLLEFLPNSPTLMNAGRPLGQLAACFVVPVDDSTTGVFEAVRWAAEIQKTGGGTGFSFSRLRPAGDLVASTGGTASGPVSLMQVFDVATEAIKQGGTRRGANMGILRVDHPDILEFIAIKLDPTRMRNFNLSVAVTDAFMAAVRAGTRYALVNPRTGQVTGELDARRVLDAIASAAWACGDPGLVFIDRINQTQPTPELGAIEATNPCGEEPLLAFESCTLGSIDVGRFVTTGELDWVRLAAVIRDAVRFLDDVIDANRYPLPEIERATKATRKIGLGIMGWADALAALGLAYDSEPALALAARLAGFLERESLAASAALAERRGSFPAWPGSRWQRAGHPALRNSTTTTIAPTGTISIIAGCASGIEPLYALAYRRNVLDGAELTEINPHFRRIAAERGFASDALFAAIALHGGVRGRPDVPADVQRVFPTAHEVDVATHVRMQAAFQRHVHAAVSKTINLRHDATADDVKAAYQLAYELGCKGITVYRDGSRDGQVLVTGARSAVVAASPSCPECGSALVVQSGCRLCRHCGWSVCG
jgi:ribonucleoside-diphosphate reductase alpha chain